MSESSRLPKQAETVTHAPDVEQLLGGTLSPVADTLGAEAIDAPRLQDIEPNDTKSLPEFPGYELLSVLGRGGMGVVYRARQIKLNRVVALKMIIGGAHAGPAELERFRNEAHAIARVQHPNIVQIFEVGEHEGLPFFSLEFCGGGSLENWLRGKPLPSIQAARMIETLAGAIHAAHQKGIIHRDLKPANVLLADDGTPKVTDFGLAKIVDVAGQTVSGTVMGTPSYMAPEQASGRVNELGPAADVYSLGALLYECLTGKPPFKAAKPLDTVLLVIQTEPISPTQLNASVPRDLETICLKCLRKEPEARYGNARLLAEDLNRFVSGEAISARPTGLWETAWKWPRRRPVKAALVAGLTCSLFALAVAFFFAWRVDAEKRELAIDKAMTAVTSGDMDRAQQAITEAERFGASAGQLQMLRGQLAFYRGKTQEALECLQRAAKLLPQSVAARGMLAAAYANNGEWDRFQEAIEEIQHMTPVTTEDFLFKGYAESNQDPEHGLRAIDEAIKQRPSMNLARLIRAEVRTWIAGDNGDPKVAAQAIEDTRMAKSWLPEDPVAQWVSLSSLLTAAGIQGRLGNDYERNGYLALAKIDADSLIAFPDLPDAVVFRWLYYREIDKEDEVRDELSRACEQSEHVYLNTCYALTLYKLGEPKAALAAFRKKGQNYSARLEPFLLAETDGKDAAWDAYRKFSESCKYGESLMGVQSVLRLIGENAAADRASQDLAKHPELFPSLRKDPSLRCLDYNAGKLEEEKLEKVMGKSLWNQAMAHFYIGMRNLGDGQRDAARERFQKVLNTKAYFFAFYDLSWVFLERLRADPTWPQRLSG